MEIKTAEDFLIEIDRLHGDDTVHATKEEIIEIMTDFAKQFVEFGIEDLNNQSEYQSEAYLKHLKSLIK